MCILLGKDPHKINYLETDVDNLKIADEAQNAAQKVTIYALFEPPHHFNYTLYTMLLFILFTNEKRRKASETHAFLFRIQSGKHTQKK